MTFVFIARIVKELLTNYAKSCREAFEINTWITFVECNTEENE